MSSLTVAFIAFVVHCIFLCLLVALIRNSKLASGSLFNRWSDIKVALDEAQTNWGKFTIFLLAIFPFVFRRVGMWGFFGAYAAAGFSAVAAMAGTDWPAFLRELKPLLLDFYDWVERLMRGTSEAGQEVVTA